MGEIYVVFLDVRLTMSQILHDCVAYTEYRGAKTVTVHDVSVLLSKRPVAFLFH